jgi:hypothetical protein
METLLLFGGGLVALPLLVLAVLAIVASRGDADPTGRRPYAVYLVAVSFIALFVALFGAFGVVNDLMQIPVNEEAERDYEEYSQPASSEDPGVLFDEFGNEVPQDFGEVFFEGEFPKPDDEKVGNAVQAALIALPALAVLLFHTRLLRRFTASPDFEGSPSARAYRAYLYSVCFFAVLIVLFAASSSGYGVFRAVAPGITGDDKAGPGIAQLVSSSLLAIAAWVIFMRFWRETRGDRLATAPVVTASPGPLPAP